MSLPPRFGCLRMPGPVGMDPVGEERAPQPGGQPRGALDWALEPGEGLETVSSCAATIEDLAQLRAEIVRIALQEWQTWHPVRETGRRAGRRRNYREMNRTMREVLTDYWSTGADISMHHRHFDDQAWSSAFICWVLRNAGAGDRWVYTRRHSEYIHAAIQNRDSDNGNPFRAYRVPEVTLELGDIVCANRGAGITYAAARRRTKYKSHSDIVVSHDGDKIVTIGGNVGDTVKKKTVRLDNTGHLRPRRYFAVIKIENTER